MGFILRRFLPGDAPSSSGLLSSRCPGSRLNSVSPTFNTMIGGSIRASFFADAPALSTWCARSKDRFRLATSGTSWHSSTQQPFARASTLSLGGTALLPVAHGGARPGTGATGGINPNGPGTDGTGSCVPAAIASIDPELLDADTCKHASAFVGTRTDLDTRFRPFRKTCSRRSIGVRPSCMRRDRTPVHSCLVLASSASVLSMRLKESSSDSCFGGSIGTTFELSCPQHN